MHVKRFLDWIGLKEKLHLGSQQIPLVHAGELWWASLGENVGFEMNGKSGLFTRPVIVFKKLANGFYFVVPVTTQIKTGTWYIHFTQNRKVMAACLQQARSIDYRRLYSRLGRLDDVDYGKIKEGFWRLYR